MERSALSPRKDVRERDIPEVLNVFFPGKCNLACTYCFVRKEEAHVNDIDEQAVLREIDVFFDYPGRKKTLSFNGGEPLLEWDLVKTVHAYAKELAKRKGLFLETVIVTNGTLLRQEHVDYFHENDISVRISIDGDRTTHDRSRPFRANTGVSSFDVVMNNIRSIRPGAVRLSASVVFGPTSVDSLLENILFLRRNGFEVIDFFPEIYATWDKDALKKLKEEAKKIEKLSIRMFTDPDEKPFKTSMLDMIVNGSTAGKQSSCGKLQTDSLGTFYACDKVFSLPYDLRNSYAIGTVDTGVDEEKRIRILEDSRKGFLLDSALGCDSCVLKSYCSCPIGQHIHKRHTTTGDPSFWKSFCRVSKILITMNLNVEKRLRYNDRFVEWYRF